MAVGDICKVDVGLEADSLERLELLDGQSVIQKRRRRIGVAGGAIVLWCWQAGPGDDVRNSGDEHRGDRACRHLPAQVVAIRLGQEIIDPGKQSPERQSHGWGELHERKGRKKCRPRETTTLMSGFAGENA